MITTDNLYRSLMIIASAERLIKTIEIKSNAFKVHIIYISIYTEYRIHRAKIKRFFSHKLCLNYRVSLLLTRSMNSHQDLISTIRSANCFMYIYIIYNFAASVSFRACIWRETVPCLLMRL